jgi:hypothetical protein
MRAFAVYSKDEGLESIHATRAGAEGYCRELNGIGVQTKIEETDVPREILRTLASEVIPSSEEPG